MRTNAREAVLNIVFAMQFNEDISDSFILKVYHQFDLKEDDVLYANRLRDAVTVNSEKIIQTIDKFSDHYHADRLNRMDKSILSVAIAEILYFEEVPNVVAASEATNLAGKYSSEQSVNYVNGVLAGVIKQSENR